MRRVETLMPWGTAPRQPAGNAQMMPAIFACLQTVLDAFDTFLSIKHSSQPSTEHEPAAITDRVFRHELLHMGTAAQQPAVKLPRERNATFVGLVYECVIFGHEKRGPHQATQGRWLVSGACRGISSPVHPSSTLPPRFSAISRGGV